jgi:hypothetical protein
MAGNGLALLAFSPDHRMTEPTEANVAYAKTQRNSE